MNVTSQQVALVAEQLAAVAGVFSPGNAAAIALLLQTAATLNTLIQQIRTQTEADAQRVWGQVSTDFKQAKAAFEASVATPKPKD